MATRRSGSRNRVGRDQFISRRRLSEELPETPDERQEEILILKKRLAQLEAAAYTHGSTTMDATPDRTSTNRFLPSEALAYNLIKIAEQADGVDDVLPEDEHSTQEASLQDIAVLIRTTISQTLDSVVTIEASIAASEGRTVSPIAEPNGRFTDRVATNLLQSLTLNPYDAPEFLGMLQSELYAILQQGPIVYGWGELYAKDEHITIAATAIGQYARSTPQSTFYRSLDGIT